MTQAGWELDVAGPAERALARLPGKAAPAIVEFMLGPLRDEPTRVGRPLGAPFEGLWAARRGPYRILYELDEAEHRVRVVAVEHRSDVYRRR